MSVKYVTAPHAEWIWATVKGVDFLAKVVTEPEPAPPRKTGLLDASGTPIYRLEVHNPIGFVRFKEC